MIELVFLQRIYGRVSKRSFEEHIVQICEKLDVEVEKVTILAGDWVKVEVVGEDEVVAANLLMKRVFAPTVTSWNDLHQFSVCNSRITLGASSKTELGVVIHAAPSAVIHALIPLKSLQSSLADGRKFALKRIISLFGLVEDFPLEVRVIDINRSTLQCQVELTENQISIYDNWIKSRVDRLLVFGTLEKSLLRVIRRLNLNRDVISVKSLSLLEHVLTCKLGTDARGLIPRLGKHLPSVKLHVFSPRSILRLIGSRD
ncbi:MAG: DUF2110 family protein [Candidatus Bathyarchaeota archaeon]|nr:MAG: DUF2110 family protein [Candidatus Bathyarchaeota archaeon]